ncbi:MAG: DUF1565 domain-containing protein, partial [Chitinispirillaceae bacterium]|nr:DUF1565 domain-containing protein [Chitinispirillaceae bacterium]
MTRRFPGTAIAQSVVALALVVLPLEARQLFVATGGNDGAAGTSAAPLATIGAAVDLASPGDTIYVRGGSYKLTGGRISLDKNGSAGLHYRIWAYPGETPVLDGSGLESGNNIIHIRGNYWHLKGLVIENSPDNGMRIGGNSTAASGGSFNIIENCVFRYNDDSGIQIGRSATSNPNDGNYASDNLILNCDSHNNCDGSGSNADGFACKL